MNLNTFEQEQRPHHIHTEGSSFERDDVGGIKHKIEIKKAKQKKVRAIIGSLVVLVFVLMLFAGYSQYRLYVLTNAEKGISTNQQEGVVVDQKQTLPKTGEEVVRALKRHILLPEGDPQIAEIEDVEKLRDTQAFFKNAENGDIVVVYQTMIYVYRPSLDVVIASGDISGAGQVKP